MELTKFSEKLNKIDGNIYVIEEAVDLVNGIYDGVLKHDNINLVTLSVHAGPKLTGDRIESYALSTPSLTPWKREIRIYADVPRVYISYECDGDTVEAEDINTLQDAVTITQKALNSEKDRAEAAEQGVQRALDIEASRAMSEEQRLDTSISTEKSRAEVAETQLADNLAYEASRAQAKETELQGNIDAHTDAIASEIQALKAADIALDEKKANVTDVSRELADRYIKSEVFTKEEILRKIDDLIGTAPETLDTFREIADALGNDPNFAATIMNLLSGKVDKEAGKQLTSNDYSDSEMAVVADVNAKKHTHSNKSILDKLTQTMLDNLFSAYAHISDAIKHISSTERINWTDAYNKRHEHENRSVIDKLTQAMLDKLTGIAAGAEVNVQPDWSAIDIESDAYIKNKPTSMPASDVPAWAKAADKPKYDWSEIIGRPGSYPPTTHTHTKAQISDMPTKLSDLDNDKGYLTATDIDMGQSHTHENKSVLDKITQTMLDKIGKALTVLPAHNHTKSQITDFPASMPANGGDADSVDGHTVKTDVPAGAKFTDTIFTHPNSGVTVGTYQSVTVDAQGHVTGGIQQGPLTWNQVHGAYTWDLLKGV